MQDAFALYTDVKQKGPFSKTWFLSHYVEGPLSYCICNSHFCFCYAFIHAAFCIVIRISLVGGGGEVPVSSHPLQETLLLYVFHCMRF